MLADNPYMSQDAIGQHGKGGRDRRGYRNSPRGYRGSSHWNGGGSFFSSYGQSELRRGGGGSGSYQAAADHLPGICEQPSPLEGCTSGVPEFHCETPSTGGGHADSDTDAISAALTPQQEASPGSPATVQLIVEQEEPVPCRITATPATGEAPSSIAPPAPQQATADQDAGPSDLASVVCPEGTGGMAAPTVTPPMPTIDEDCPLPQGREPVHSPPPVTPPRPSYSEVASSPRRTAPRLNASDPVVSPGRITMASRYKAARHTAADSGGVRGSTVRGRPPSLANATGHKEGGKSSDERGGQA